MCSLQQRRVADFSSLIRLDVYTQRVNNYAVINLDLLAFDKKHVMSIVMAIIQDILICVSVVINAAIRQAQLEQVAACHMLFGIQVIF